MHTCHKCCSQTAGISKTHNLDTWLKGLSPHPPVCLVGGRGGGGGSPFYGLKEGLWCVECLWAPKSFPAQVSAHLENKNIRPGRQLIPKRNLKTENSLNQTQQPGPGTHTKTTTTNNSWSVAKSDQCCTSLDTSKVSQVINIKCSLKYL